MALVKEYNSKGGISGFSLGFHEFFRRFYFGVNNIDGRQYTGFIYHGMGIFRARNYCNCRHEVDYPCMDCRFSHCPHQKEEICFRCCESGYYGDILWHDYYSIRDLFEFTLYQRAWIKTQRDSKELKNECRKRINFFISKLDEFFKERSHDRDIFLDRQTFKEIQKFSKTCLDKI